ncbi:MAG: RHS repeat protein, partial [Clostridia bacterium]|nr:RHS repeat protein [Clostridia bacterium]
ITDLGGTSSATFNSIVEDLTESKTEIGAGYYVSTVKVGTLIYADLISKLEENSVNARVLDAKLTLAQINSSCGSARVVQAHRITSDWGVSNIAEDTPRVNTAVPNYENTVLDYYRTPSSLTAGDQFEIDITSAVQKWATGHSENYGIYLEVADSDGTKDLVYWGSSDQSAFEKPQFSINYRDTMGVEDYWTYSSVSAGRYGMAAVNNYNGNLVSTQTICGTDGLRLPVEIALTYNSGITGEAKFTKAGTGWKFNFETLICASEESIAADYPYYLLDSDGTKHYFEASDEENEWVDEDGLGLTLTYENFANSNSVAYYILTATDGSYSKFYYPGGRIYRTYDTEGNYIQINYSSGLIRISSVRDGAGRTYSFTYEGGRVSAITDPANRVYTFAYDDDLLESITYPDGVKTEFTYTSLTGGDSLLSAVSNPDETSTRITYKNGKHNRVDTLGTYSSDAQRMSQLSFDYASPNRTVVTDLDGRKLEYQFDRMGQTINLFYPEEQMAAYYEYGAEGGATKKITESSKVQAPTVNLITNHGFKDLTGWSAENGGSATGTAELSTSVCFADNNSLLVVKTDTNPDSVLGRKYTVGALGAGYYTLSAYLKTENLTAYTADGGAKLVLTYTDADGAVQKAQSAPISTSEDWQRLSVTLRTETAITNATVSLVVENANGTAYFDAVQFEAAAVANRYNLLYNNDLEQSSSGALSEWSTRALTSADGPSTSEHFTGEHSFHIQGSPTAYKNISQRVNVSGDAKDSFVYSAFAKGTSRPNDGNMYTFSVVVEFYNADGFTERFITPFNFGSDDWQYVSGAAVASEPYTYVQFYLCYYRNVNDVYFDAPQFYREKFGDSYTYDDEGNLTSVTDAADTETTYEYDENNELVSVNNPSGTSDTFVYDENKPHRLISETVAGLNTSYSYDNYGNSLGSIVRLADDSVSSAHISNSSTYTDNGNYLASETDT